MVGSHGSTAAPSYAAVQIGVVGQGAMRKIFAAIPLSQCSQAYHHHTEGTLLELLTLSACSEHFLQCPDPLDPHAVWSDADLAASSV